MGIREDRIRALTFDHPQHIPVAVSVLPATSKKEAKKAIPTSTLHALAGPRASDGSSATTAAHASPVKNSLEPGRCSRLRNPARLASGAGRRNL